MAASEPPAEQRGPLSERVDAEASPDSRETPDAGPPPAPRASAPPGSPVTSWKGLLRRPAVWIDAGVVALSLSLVARANAQFTFPRPSMMSLAEGTSLAEAYRLLEGDLLPYVDAVGTSGPVYSWIVAAAVGLLGVGSWLPARVVVLVCMLGTLGLAAGAAFMARRRVAAGLGALVYVGVAVALMWRDPGLALGVEQVGNLFAMGALFAMSHVARGPGPARAPRLWAWVAGALVSLAGLCKLVDLVALLPLAAWAYSLDRVQPARRRRLFALLLGALLPLAVVALRYTIAGELNALYEAAVYGLTRYRPTIHTPTAPDYLRDAILGHLDLLLVWTALAGASVAFFVSRTRGLRDLPRAYAELGFEATVALGAIAVLLVIDGSVEVFEWDYIPLVPWASLLVAVVLERSAGLAAADRSRSPRRAVLVHSALLLPLAIAVTMGCIMRVRLYAKSESFADGFETAKWPLCEYLSKNVKAGESIFIWGDDAAPYVACNRFPASRYVTTGAVAGFVPWIDESAEVEGARAIPGSRESLAAELRDQHPPVIIDSSDTLMGRSLFQHAPLRDLMVKSYCRAPAYGPSLWVRKPDDGCSSAPGARLLTILWDAAHKDCMTVADKDALKLAKEQGAEVLATAGAVFAEPAPGLVALKQFINTATGMHFATSTPEGEARALDAGYSFERVEGYVFGSRIPNTMPLTLFYQPVISDYCTVAGDSWGADYSPLGVQGYVPLPDVIPDVNLLGGGD